MQPTNQYEKLERLVNDLAHASDRLKQGPSAASRAMELGLMEQRSIEIYSELQHLRQMPTERTEGSPTTPATPAPAHPTPGVSELKAQFAKLKSELQELDSPRSTEKLEVASAPIPEPGPKPESKDKLTLETVGIGPAGPTSIEAEVPAQAPPAKHMETTPPTIAAEPIEAIENQEKAASLHEKLHTAKQPSLHERLTKTQDAQQQINRQMAGKPIKDLTKAISINEQIVLIRELFDNDKRAFKRAVEFINKCHTFSEARSYVHHDLAKQFKNWEENNMAYENFMGLVKRRFI
ncbi:MAG: hypothetical protein HYZ16_03150 [Bacteroidetes bacterium]|jgi:hypothetical protein|nr:hypothetical protein [Bacteroidota bacterium]